MASGAADILSDRPIERARDDLFGRQAFARTIAATITSWGGAESLTIAISGPWGSGKSSLKNMILEAMPEKPERRPYPVEFNPWKYATPSETAKAFFREVSIALRRVDPTKTGEDRAKRWDRYSKLLTLTSELAQGAVDAFPAVMGLAAFVGASAIATPSATASLILGILSILLTSAAVALKFSAAFSSKVAEWLRATSTDEPIEDIKKKLQDDLKELRRPVLVIVDDIDRLTRRETRELFQHLKANVDFPNVLYLLLYQQDIVERHLTTRTLNGRQYLEKIVDLHFDLPTIGQEDINKMLFAGLNRLLATVKHAPKFEEARWGNVYLGSLQVFFKTPRNVKRFLSTLAVHLKLFQGEHAFEVNPIDLIAIEALRVFEPPVFWAISTSEAILTRSRQSREDSQQRKAAIEKIVELAAIGHRDVVRDLLKELFPRVAGALGGSEYGDDWIPEWTNSQRVCSPEFFKRYFRLAVPQRELSQSEFQLLIIAASNRKEFVASIQDLKASGQLDAAMLRLDDYKQKIPLEYAAEFLPALFDIGDELEDGPGAFLGPFVRATRIALWYVREEPSVEKRGQLLITAMKASNGLSVPARLLRGEDERRQKGGSDESFTIFTTSQLEEAKQLWIDKFVARSGADIVALAGMPRFISMLYAWREWRGEDVVRTWVQKLLESEEGLVTFLAACAGVVTSHTWGDRTETRRLVTRLQTIADFASVDEIESRVAALARDKLTQEDSDAIASFERALKRRAMGKSDDGFGDEE